MSVENLFLYFLACGAATFPLGLVLVRWIASLAPNASLSRRIERAYEPALSLSLVIWILGALIFYVVALHIERQKPCTDQHTNQLTAECRKELGAPDHR
ncbi:MAG: hypothetical protein AB7F22_10090 [Reyranella sp.]|uniref:hypothetical protein n=1 Tax=Reyranella sp. TaxID=1929291 RepID=UPI003D0FECB5